MKRVRENYWAVVTHDEELCFVHEPSYWDMERTQPLVFTKRVSAVGANKALFHGQHKVRPIYISLTKRKPS